MVLFAEESIGRSFGRPAHSTWVQPKPRGGEKIHLLRASLNILTKRETARMNIQCDAAAGRRFYLDDGASHSGEHE